MHVSLLPGWVGFCAHAPYVTLLFNCSLHIHGDPLGISLSWCNMMWHGEVRHDCMWWHVSVLLFYTHKKSFWYYVTIDLVLSSERHMSLYTQSFSIALPLPFPLIKVKVSLQSMNQAEDRFVGYEPIYMSLKCN